MLRFVQQLLFLPTNPYPGIHLKTGTLLNCPGTLDAAMKAIKTWNGEELEEAGVAAGVVIPLSRPLQQILEMDVYRKNLRDRPLISVEKIGESAPVSFTPNPHAPLSGIRALGLGHVIAGAAVGRALALHGADVLNVWNPEDGEHNVFLLTSHVGTRSTTLRIKESEARKTFMELMKTADVFYSNRRHGYLNHHDLTAYALCKQFPGLIHTSVAYIDDSGPWSHRVGFDLSTGLSMGLDCLEGTDEKAATSADRRGQRLCVGLAGRHRHA